MIEQWDEMGERHFREKYQALQSLNQSGYTQTEAAQLLGMSLTRLNNWVRAFNIKWIVKRQGRKRHEAISRTRSGI